MIKLLKYLVNYANRKELRTQLRRYCEIEYKQDADLVFNQIRREHNV